ncbi:MAG: hypothetical protein ACYDCM_10360 [Candidatus Acidiferrales bacterium]
MKIYKLAVLLAIAALSAIPSAPAFAQEKPGNVTLITEMTPKPGAEKQFEEGLKQLAAWHASMKDPQARVAFMQISPTPDEILKNAFGKDEATATVNEVSALIGGHFTQEVIMFRPDLSYFPKK